MKNNPTYRVIAEIAIEGWKTVFREGNFVKAVTEVHDNLEKFEVKSIGNKNGGQTSE